MDREQGAGYEGLEFRWQMEQCLFSSGISAVVSVSIFQLQKKIRRHTERIVEAMAKDEITLVSVSVQNKKTRQLGQRPKKYQYLTNTKFNRKENNPL